ncbi:MAG: hypothetical protein JNL97_02735, partial [Verrucomicrobiales bacterium]|nr:hypothetical protein [Verrucomicrobiales bacterium]
MGPRRLATLVFALALALATGTDGLAADGMEGAPTPPVHEIGTPPVIHRDLAEDFSIRLWRQTDGLPSDRVQCVLPSRDGYVWVGTAAGLGRFDGLRWVRFDQGNVPLLTDHRIRGLAEDGHGDLWIATEDLRCLVFGGDGWSIPDFPGTDWAILHDIADAPDGSVFFWSTRGWLRSRRDRDTSTGVGFPALEPIPGMSGDTVGAGNAPDGRRVRVEREAFILEAADGRTLERHAIRPRPASANFTASVASTPDGAVWALTGVADRPEGFDLWRWSPGAFRHVDGAAPQPRRTFLTSDGARGVWHCAESGRVAHTTPERRTRYALPSSRAEVFALDVATAADGGIWIAVENGGLLQLRPRRIEAIRPPGGGKRAMVRSVLPEDSGVVWAGTEDGVIRVTADPSKGGWAVEPAGLEGQSVRSLARDPGGTLWAGTGRGLYADRGAGWRPVDLPRIAHGASDGDGFGSIKVRDLLARRDGSVWIASAHQVAAVP